MSASGFRVMERLDGVHPDHPEYPLLPGDLLVRAEGAWWKEAPGLAVGGFILTTEQEATLRPVQFDRVGLTYSILGDAS